MTVAIEGEQAEASNKVRTRRRWSTAIILVVLVLAGGLWLVYRVQRSGEGAGPLTASHPFRYNVNGHPGRRYIWATVYLRNPSGNRLTIDAVNPHPSRGLRVVELRLGNPRGWHAVGGFYSPWPPQSTRPHDLVPVHGLVLPPHQMTRLFAELVAPNPGRYFIGGAVQVRYRVGGTTYRKVFHNEADLLVAKA